MFEQLEVRTNFSATAFPVIASFEASDEFNQLTLAGVPTFLEVADFDLDGRKDVLFANAGSAQIGWFRQTEGDGTFEPVRLVASPEGMDVVQIQALEVADLDGDGAVDVVAVVSTRNQQVDFFIAWNNGGVFEPTGSLRPKGFDDYVATLFSQDFDGDQDLDIGIGAGSEDFILHNNGRRSFLATRLESIASRNATDADNDGDMDLLGEDGIYINDGNGNFSPSDGSFRTGGQLLDLLFADVNGDELLDIVTTSWIPGEAAVNYELSVASAGDYILRGLIGKGPRLNSGGDEFPQVFGQMVPGDVDGDGDNDLLVAEHGTLGTVAGTVIWLENLDGNGSFGERKLIVDHGGSSTVEFTDIDGDGQHEVVVASTSLVSTGNGARTKTRITVHEVRLIGDTNADHSVDFTDFLVLSKNFGKQVDAVWEDGDFNLDGGVSFEDFLLLSGNFGSRRTTN